MDENVVLKPQRHSESYDDGVLENSFGEEPDFSDPEDFVDDASDEELFGDLLKKKPKETDGIDSVIVVDNVPQVGAERMEKLQNVLRKIFGKFGKIQTEHMPMQDGVSKGYMFLEYTCPREAAEAVKSADGYKLDKQHTFEVNLFTDFDKYASIPDEWETPEPQPYKDPGNLRYYLQQKSCYDQFSVIYDGGAKTAMMLNATGEPSVIEERANWTETYVRWSPSGNYLATFHKRGIALWGGETNKQIMRFQHDGVQLIDFSPCEKYLVTFSPLMDSKEEPQAVIVWEVLTGNKKRGFHCENASVWPIFKWCADGKYFARMTNDLLSIYETPSFGLLDKKSLKVKGIKDFGWSPTDNLISYWTPEERDTPARVVIIKVPSRETYCQKNLFTVKDCRLHWQKAGDYLCVKVDRYKSKKEEKDIVKYGGVFHNFNIFRIREKECPVDTIDQQDPIVAFAWEPVGNKFAFIHGEVPRIAVSVYVIKKQANVELLKTLDKKSCNHMFWSPNGQFIVLAGLRSQNGLLEFVDTNDMTIMATAEHFMATDVEWDPTGRFIATAVSWWGHKVDNAFWLWNFQGKLLHKQPMEKFCQLLWRPRPASLLSKDKVKEIKKNMKKYNSRFSLEDKMRESKASKEQIERRRTLMEEYDDWALELKTRFKQDKSVRLTLRDNVDTDEVHNDFENFEEETIEFLDRVEDIILEE